MNYPGNYSETLKKKKEKWKLWVANNQERYETAKKQWEATHKEERRAHSRDSYWRKREYNVRKSFINAQNDREKFQNAFLAIMEELLNPKYRLMTPIVEPKMNPCYTRKDCICGQIFFTDGQIPQHICKTL